MLSEWGEAKNRPARSWRPFADALGGNRWWILRAGQGRGETPPKRGYWLIVQDQGLVVADRDALELPYGEDPIGFDGRLSDLLWLGTWREIPCWITNLPREATVPPGFRRETLVPDCWPGIRPQESGVSKRCLGI